MKHTVPCFFSLPHDKPALSFLAEAEDDFKEQVLLLSSGEVAPRSLPQYLFYDILKLYHSLVAFHCRQAIIKSISSGLSSRSSVSQARESSRSSPTPYRNKIIAPLLKPSSRRLALISIRSLNRKGTVLSLKWNTAIARIMISDSIHPVVLSVSAYSVMPHSGQMDSAWRPQREHGLEKIILGSACSRYNNSLEDLIIRLESAGWI